MHTCWTLLARAGQQRVLVLPGIARLARPRTFAPSDAAGLAGIALGVAYWKVVGRRLGIAKAAAECQQQQQWQ